MDEDTPVCPDGNEDGGEEAEEEPEVAVKSEDVTPLPLRNFRPSFLSGSFNATVLAHTTDLPLKATKPEKSFRPNMTMKSSSSCPSLTSEFGGSFESGSLDIGSMLAHSLQMKAQGSPQVDHHQIRRGARGPVAARTKNTQATSLQAKLANLRKGKKEGKKKSKHLMEISWADDKAGQLSSYRPVSLPYVARDDSEDETQTGSKRPTAKIVDEANRNTAAVFADEDDSEEPDDSYRNWFLIQMPVVLPAICKAAMDTSDVETNKENAPKNKRKSAKSEKPNALSQLESEELASQPSQLAGIPSGRLGVLKLHASGRVKLWIKNHGFDVNQGSECHFAQDVGCLLENNSEFIFLGKCSKRLVVVPDIERMVEIAKPAFMQDGS